MPLQITAAKRRLQAAVQERDLVALSSAIDWAQEVSNATGQSMQVSASPTSPASQKHKAPASGLADSAARILRNLLLSALSIPVLVPLVAGLTVLVFSLLSS